MDPSAAGRSPGGSGGVDEALVQELRERHTEVEALGADLERQLGELHDLQDRFESAMAKQRKLAKAFASEAAEVDTMASSTPSQAPSPSVRGSQNAQLHARCSSSLARLAALEPTSGGAFVRMFLGTINVRFQRKKERLLFKEQYEIFKVRCSPVFALACVFCLVFEKLRWPQIMLQFLLAYYYVTLALRENILQKNGSHIRQWWITHHYVSILAAILLLTWPNSDSYTEFRPALHLYGLYNSLLQIVSARYQKARLYAMKALGKAGEMDVANTDSSQVHWSESMMVLIPLVLIGQGFQSYISFVLFRIFINYTSDFNILILAFLFLTMFLGNLLTTIFTLREKAHRKTVKQQ